MDGRRASFPALITPSKILMFGPAVSSGCRLSHVICNAEIFIAEILHTFFIEAFIVQQFNSVTRRFATGLVTVSVPICPILASKVVVVTEAGLKIVVDNCPMVAFVIDALLIVALELLMLVSIPICAVFID